MKKFEVMNEFDLKSTSIFLSATVAFTLSSAMLNISSAFDSGTVGNSICSIVSIVASLFTCVMTIKGFGVVNKASKLSEKNENYYLGRNLQILSVSSIVITVILTVAAFIFAMMVAQYDAEQGLSASDVQARNNLLVIMAIISIVMQIFDITLPYIVYLWKIHRMTNGGNNLALLTVIVMVAQLAIACINAVYVARGSGSDFLPAFTNLMEVIEGIALVIFFMVRRQKLIAAPAAE